MYAFYQKIINIKLTFRCLYTESPHVVAEEYVYYENVGEYFQAKIQAFLQS